jgi:ATP-dependent Clp endopeptidase proteolytic subunit ClpP
MPDLFDPFTADYRELRTEALRLEVIKGLRDERDISGSNYRNRIIDFVGEVSEMRCHACIDLLGKLSRESAAPITIRFDSQGGNVTDGLALYDYIMLLRRDGIEVHTQGFGLVASMAAVLLQAGTTRSLSPRVRLLIHEVSSVAFGSYTEQVEQTAETRKVQDILLDILTERSSLSKAVLRRKWKKTDWWLGADESVELGLADAVLR